MYAAIALTRPTGWNVCSRCLARSTTAASSRMLYRSSIHTKRKLSGAIVPDDEVQKNMTIQSQPSFHDYFSSNTSIDRGWIRNGLFAAWQTKTMAWRESKTSNVRQHGTEQSRSSREQSLPALLDDSVQPASAQEVQITDTLPSQTQSIKEEIVSDVSVLRRRRRHQRTVASQDTSDAEQQLPLDASSQLTTAASELPTSATLRRMFATYLSLTKPRLSFLIILTTTSAYSLYPIPDIISSATHAADASSTLSTSTLTLTFLSVGTFLSSASANTFNMLFEPKYDAMMSRTRNRPLVRKLISQRAALAFAILCGASGILLLHLGTNPTVAALSALNVFLYAGVYTPMKRLSPLNTWVGAIVGGIPPLMGWCAAAGEVATSEHHSWRDLLLSEDSVGGWLLAALLFAWQFPHFNSLSHTIRNDYRQAGHKMLAWINPAMNARVALRYSVAMFPICAGLYWAGIVNEGFLVISTGCNVWMTKEAIRFWKNQGAGGSARGLFWASVWQLPLILVGALVCKTGIWSGFFGSDEDQPTSIYDDGEAITGNDGVKDHSSALSMPSAIEGSSQLPLKPV